MKAAVLLVVAALGAQAGPITRATAHVNGVTSPRGFFNLTVRIYQLDGVEWAKYDMKKSLITLDFAPGKTASVQQVQSVMALAGYKPGAVEVTAVEAPASYDHRLGWNRIRRPKSKNPVARWFELNF